MSEERFNRLEGKIDTLIDAMHEQGVQIAHLQTSNEIREGSMTQTKVMFLSAASSLMVLIAGNFIQKPEIKQHDHTNQAKAQSVEATHSSVGSTIRFPY
jgi:hypothetical protein